MAQSERLALVIGVDGYKSPLLAPLPSCRKDAFDIAKEFSTAGYSIYDNGPLIGSNIQDPNAWSKIRESIINYFNKSKPSQKLIFYFSGHGLSRHGEIYLATPEVDPESPRLAGFALSELTSLISECKSKQIVCIIDACYSGTADLPESRYTKKAAKDEAELALAAYDKIWKKTPKARGIYFMLSSQAYEPSLALEDNNSLYTRFLIDGLRGVQPMDFDENGRIIKWSGSVEENGDITPNSLHAYIYHKVAESTKQVPQLKTVESSGFDILSRPTLAFGGLSAVETMFDAANRYASDNEYQDALIFIDKALRIDSKHTRALALKADVLARMKHYSDCLRIINTLLSVDPKNSKIQTLKKQVIEKEEYALTKEGQSLQKAGYFDKAIECFDRAIAIDPKYHEAWAAKAFILTYLSRYPESSQCFDEALAIEREDKQLWVGKGFTLHRMFEDKAAFECFDRAIAIDSEYPEGWIGKGASLHHMAEYTNAIECFDRAIAINSGIPQAWIGKGFSIMRKDDFIKAIECFDRAIAIDPKYHEAWVGKEWCLLSQGEMTEARVANQRARTTKQSFIRGSTNLETEPLVKRKALVIGTSEYDTLTSLRNIPFSENDAISIYECLYDDGYIIPDDCRLIGRVEGYTMRKSIWNFFINSNKDDVLFFYYSGHGIPDSFFGNYHLASTNIDPRAPMIDGFSQHELGNAILMSPAKKIIVILDSAFSGNMGAVDRPGVCIIAATFPGQAAFKKKGLPYSAFTYYLIEGLKGAGGRTVNKKGEVTIEGLSRYAYDKLEKESRQTPIIKNIGAGDIVLIRYPELLERLPSLGY